MLTIVQVSIFHVYRHLPAPLRGWVSSSNLLLGCSALRLILGTTPLSLDTPVHVFLLFTAGRECCGDSCPWGPLSTPHWGFLRTTLWRRQRPPFFREAPLKCKVWKQQSIVWRAWDTVLIPRKWQKAPLISHRANTHWYSLGWCPQPQEVED